jgi:hypothetical protein
VAPATDGAPAGTGEAKQPEANAEIQPESEMAVESGAKQAEAIDGSTSEATAETPRTEQKETNVIPEPPAEQTALEGPPKSISPSPDELVAKEQI